MRGVMVVRHWGKDRKSRTGPLYQTTALPRFRDHKPNTGPGNSSNATQTPHALQSPLVSQIAGRVRPKPTAFITARDEPTVSLGAVAAASAENCGESATTATPQTSNKAISNSGGKIGRASCRERVEISMKAQ